MQGWGLVKVMHVMGDRRDHFVALQDITDLFRVIVEERKRREIDPTLALLRECVNEFDPKWTVCAAEDQDDSGFSRAAEPMA